MEGKNVLFLSSKVSCTCYCYVSIQEDDMAGTTWQVPGHLDGPEIDSSVKPVCERDNAAL